MSCQTCNSKTQQNASKDQIATRFDSFWPETIPFPPTAPWMATVLDRKSLYEYVVDNKVHSGNIEGFYLMFSESGIESRSVIDDVMAWLSGLWGSGEVPKPKCTQTCVLSPNAHGDVGCWEGSIRGVKRECTTIAGTGVNGCTPQKYCDISDGEYDMWKTSSSKDMILNPIWE